MRKSIAAAFGSVVLTAGFLAVSTPGCNDMLPMSNN